MEGRMRQLLEQRDELHRRVAELFDKTGWESDKITDFLDNPSNFAGSIYQTIKTRRDSLKQELSVLTTSTTRQVLREQTKTEEVRKRKGKSIGQRRNWLNM